jgi:hypothetical protein
MMMLDYINAVKRGLRDKYGFVPCGVANFDQPLFADGQIPDGKYPMEIDGKIDHVLIEGGRIHCCRFREEATAEDAAR